LPEERWTEQVDRDVAEAVDAVQGQLETLVAEALGGHEP